MIPFKGNELVSKARRFSVSSHSNINQRRKYTQEPYWKHPFDVAGIVSTVPECTPEMVAAAYLHDVVEDTPVVLETIFEEFGPRVGTYVFYLTDASRPSDGNRATRKAIDREHIGKAPPKAKTIKLADMINNTKSITLYDPDFAVVYMSEKRVLLDFLEEGNKLLWIYAKNQVETYFKHYRERRGN